MEGSWSSVRSGEEGTELRNTAGKAGGAWRWAGCRVGGLGVREGRTLLPRFRASVAAAGNAGACQKAELRAETGAG